MTNKSNSSGGCCVVRTKQFSNQGEHSFNKEGTKERKGYGGTATCHACCTFPMHVLPGFKRCCGFSKQTQLGGRKSVTSRAQRERPRPFADLAVDFSSNCIEKMAVLFGDFFSGLRFPRNEARKLLFFFSEKNSSGA